MSPVVIGFSYGISRRLTPVRALFDNLANVSTHVSRLKGSEPNLGVRKLREDMAARPPEHRFTVTVIDSDTQEPMARAQVRLGIDRGATDESGQAILDVPKGDYALDVRRVGYVVLSRNVEVNQDVAIQVEALPAPDIDPDDEQVWM